MSALWCWEHNYISEFVWSAVDECFKAFDMGGQETTRSDWKNYYDHTDGLVFVIDSADRYRLLDAGKELQWLLENDEFAGIPLLVFANKQDLLQALPADEISDVLNLNLIRNRQWNIMPLSARTKEGLEEGIEWLLQTITINSFAFE